MTQISLTINDRNYEVTCDDGQEEHLRRLAGHLDERIQGLVGAVGQVGEGRLLVMASLMVADELFEAYKENHALTAEQESASGGVPGSAASAAVLETCAQRIEAIAARLGGA